MQQGSPSDDLARGMAAARAGRWEEARNILFGVIDRDPNTLDAWLWLGAIADEAEESVAYLRRAREINPRSVRAQKGMEWAQERLAARQAAQAAAPERATEPPATVLPGVDTSGMEPLTQPLATYQRPPEPDVAAASAAAGPNEPLDWDSIVARLRAAGAGGEASGPAAGAAPAEQPEASSEPGGGAAPTSVAELVESAKQQIENGETAAATASLQAVLREHPDNVEAHEQLGVSYYQAGQSREALSEFQEVVRLRPDHAEAHANIGFLQMELGQPEVAIAALRTALSYKPDLIEALVSLGELERARGNVAGAIEAWEAALALHPELADVRRNLDEARAGRGGAA